MLFHFRPWSRKALMMFSRRFLSCRAVRIRRCALSTTTTSVSPRVCIVGAGPSGFYAAKYLLKELPPTSRLDMVER